MPTFVVLPFVGRRGIHLYSAWAATCHARVGTKELVRSTADAGAGSLVPGHRAGFASGVGNTLLQGPALWVLNEGGFSDQGQAVDQVIRADGKAAADNSAIGKFDHGAKNVFHLCGRFFYVTFDGQDHVQRMRTEFALGPDG